MGYDALVLPDADDGELVRVALNQNRIFLTKDSRLMERRVITTGQVRAFLLQEDDVKAQLRKVAREFGLTSDNSFSICVCCNLPLETVRKEEVEGFVPRFVFETKDEFASCPGCRRVYWKGTHWARMSRELEVVRETQ
jgi:uncharacterized protein with PIN domain